jgi:beta-lactam-binding protein with PASTA domain
VIIPDVIGRSLEDARILLQQVGLTVGEVSWATGTALTDAAASVVSQTPAAGMEVPMRTRVNITAGSRYP